MPLAMPTSAALHMRLAQEALVKTLILMEWVIPNRSCNPLLTLSGTNLEIALAYFVPAEVKNAQSSVIPAHLFAQIVRNFPSDTFDLKRSGNEINVWAVQTSSCRSVVWTLTPG